MKTRILPIAGRSHHRKPRKPARMTAGVRRHASRETVRLAWTHAGIGYRVTPWPDASLLCQCGDEWRRSDPEEGCLSAGAIDVPDPVWHRYLEYVPPAERSLVTQFRIRRMEALLVAARCPELVPALGDTPALMPFLSAHAALRGGSRPAWDEINAVFRRAGIFGVLEWLGMPATPHTIAALRNLADPDIPSRFLAPLRTILWDPAVAAALEQARVITDLDLARHCHPLAA